MEYGTLFICPTPIGNLKDITIRTIEVLENVAYIGAEDTRVTKKLLNHLNIDKKIFSYYEHNKEKSGKQLLDLLIEGNDIALVSDAGMPGISDPGEDLIKLSIENNIKVICLPGPSAFVNALVISGLSTDKFSFEGFLDRSSGKRKKRLEKIKMDDRTLIFYEAPHRLNKFLSDAFEVLGDRKISISREITKKFEETFRGKMSEGIEFFKENNPRGEFVIVVEGDSGNNLKDISGDISSDSIKNEIKRYMEEGYTKKDSVKMVSKDLNISKNIVYKESIEI